MRSKRTYPAWGAVLAALFMISCCATTSEPQSAGTQGTTAPQHEEPADQPPSGGDEVTQPADQPPPGGDEVTPPADQPPAQEINCAEPPAVFCCQAMTPECQQCTTNAKAALEAWEKKCKASPQ
jgi:hypothetical protein